MTVRGRRPARATKRPSGRRAARSASGKAPPRKRRRDPELGLVHLGATPERWSSEAERRLDDLLSRLARLQQEHEHLSAALADFSERCDEELGDALEAVARAQRAHRRLEHLEAQLLTEAERFARGDAAPHTRSAPRPRRPSAIPSDPPAAADELTTPGPTDLKELYRRLARSLHPDLARGERDRARRSHLMARLNAAYAAEDRVRLELLALEIESGIAPHDATPETRDRLADQRQRALQPALERLERDLRWLRTTPSYRRYAEYLEHEERGTDYFDETLRASNEQLRILAGGLLPRARRVEAAVRAVNAARGPSKPAPSNRTRSNRTSSNRTTSKRAFLHPFRDASDSLPPLTLHARRFSELLQSTARDEPWKAAWTFAAFFAEIAGRPPEGLATLDDWADRYERLRPLLRGAPRFEHALACLPPVLELGCRLHRQSLRFGLQLREPDHLAGVAAALSTPPAASIAANVLRVLGTETPCARCRRSVFPVHLRRVRDLDPLHARCCPHCATVLHGYRTVGQPEGLEVLADFALATGVLEEQVVRFGGVTLHLEMLPQQRARLTAAGLATLFADVLLAGLPHDLHARPLRVVSRRVTLAPSARIPRDTPVTVVFADREAPSPTRVVAIIRARHRRRFNTDPR